MKYFILFFLAISFVTPAAAQEGITVCHTPATESFSMLGADPDFNSSHREPLPYVHQSEIGRMITFEVADGKKANAYFLEAQVDSDDYLFVIHEWWGLNDHIKKMAEKFYSDLGTVNVLAIDLYDGKVADTREKASEYMQQVNDKRARAIIDAALDFAGNSSEIATVGWCFGGGWALQAAMLAGDEAQGAVMYYGMPEKDIETIKEKVNFPVLGIFAKKDEWITPEMVEGFQKNMREASKELVVHFYEADHAFANPSNPDYDEDATKDAYDKSLAFLKRVLD